MSGAETTMTAPVPVKVVIAGGSGAGKTTLVETASEIMPLSSERAMALIPTSSTSASFAVAADFGRITLDRSLRVYLFGAPEQERFGLMWDGMTAGALGAIVLVDTRQLDGCFPAVDYLERAGLPFVVVLNAFDGALPHRIEDVRAALDLDPDVPVVTADARSRRDIEDSLIVLFDVVLARTEARGRG